MAITGHPSRQRRQTRLVSLRILALVLAGAFTSGCSFSLSDWIGVIPALQPPPTSTASNTPRPTATALPILPTATFTFTPTLVGQKSPTPSPVIRLTATPSAVTPAGTSTPRPQMDGLTAIDISATQFYSTACEPNTVTFTVRVGEPARVAYVVLFVRFKSPATGATGPWTDFTMEPTGPGSYTHELNATEMNAFGSFVDPWIQYQLVTTDRSINILGRTQIFDEVLSLKTSCVPTQTAVTTP